MRKKIRAGISLLLAGLTTCFAGACVNQGAINETLALQQRLEELQQQNASMKAEKENLQQQFDELNGQNQTVLDELKGLEDTINGPPLESGFYKDYPKSAYIDGETGERVALKSSRSHFDIDDVTLDFYFGDNFINPQHIEMYGNRFFDIYFTSRSASYWGESYGIKHLAKRVEESYFSKEYEYKRINLIDCGDFNRYEYEFKKCHTLTIPREIFIGNAGHFYVELRFTEIKEQDDWGEAFFSVRLYYKVKYGKVVLSANVFDEWKTKV